MEKEKEEKGGWIGIIFSIIFIVAMGSMTLESSLGIYDYFAKKHGKLSFSLHDDNLPDYIAKDEEFVGVCRENLFKTSVGVFKAKDLGDGIQGRFSGDDYLIAIQEDAKSIDTVAHEVSHFVDQVMYDKQIQDGETRAYLQGYYTQCVYAQFH